MKKGSNWHKKEQNRLDRIKTVEQAVDDLLTQINDETATRLIEPLEGDENALRGLAMWIRGRYRLWLKGNPDLLRACGDEDMFADNASGVISDAFVRRLKEIPMIIAPSKKRQPDERKAAIADIIQNVSPDRLRQCVELLSFPRHYVVERDANIRARDLLLKQFQQFSYTPVLQGAFDNILAIPPTEKTAPYVLLGAHYDSVPGCPGADDNASAIAVCLECARILRQHDIGSTMIAIFNREEDGLLGSQEFVEYLPSQSAFSVAEAHIFEMVGFCSHAAGSQALPPGLPVSVPDVGDFLALLSNQRSNAIADSLLTEAATYLDQFPVLALKTYLGIEKRFPHLNRSDHAPFWEANIPAIMWTDTSEFRNPHYHRASDTPDTLDYEYMAQVTKLALVRTLQKA